MKPFLILQLRPETDASDGEFEAILAKGGLEAGAAHRIRLDQTAIPEGLDPGDYSGVIVGGGPGCVSDPPHEKTLVEARIEAAVAGLMPQIIARDIPFMGCCYGIGILAHHLGAEVSRRRYSESVGGSDCRLTGEGRRDPLLAGIPERFTAFVGHKEAVQELPEGCAHLVESDACPFQMIRYGRNVYATQFHPELDGDGIEARIKVYKHMGYFRPEDAVALAGACRAQDVFAPERILRRFVEVYRAVA